MLETVCQYPAVVDSKAPFDIWIATWQSEYTASFFVCGSQSVLNTDRASRIAFSSAPMLLAGWADEEVWMERGVWPSDENTADQPVSPIGSGRGVDDPSVNATINPRSRFLFTLVVVYAFAKADWVPVLADADPNEGQEASGPKSLVLAHGAVFGGGYGSSVLVSRSRPISRASPFITVNGATLP